MLCAGVALLGMFSGTFAELALATAGAYVLFWFGRLKIPALLRFNRLPDVSYGVYLYAWPVQKLIIEAWPAVSPWALLPATVAASVCLGALSWYAVEKPFLRLKPSARPHPVAAAASA